MATFQKNLVKSFSYFVTHNYSQSQKKKRFLTHKTTIDALDVIKNQTRANLIHDFNANNKF